MYLCKSVYVKKVISPIQNFVLKLKRSLKNFQKKILVAYLQRVHPLKLSEKNMS